MMVLMMALGQPAQAKDICSNANEAATNSAEIKAVYDESEAQRDKRAQGDAAVLAQDEKRIKQLLKRDAAGQLCTPEDKWHAAWVMQQADTLATLNRAYELAVETMNAHLPRGPWLVAFSFDHKRVAAGYYQAYGTQTRINNNGRRCLIEVEPTFTDEQRAQFGMPTLVETYRKQLDAAGFNEDEATEQRMRKRDLLCQPLAFRNVDRRRVAPTAQ